MTAQMLTREIYRDKVYGAWLGKNVGSTFGAPKDGRKESNTLRFYDPAPGQAVANDDLDVQLVWLSTLRRAGIHLKTADLAEAWTDYIAYNWDEYSYANYNLLRGLNPPISGAINNWFKHGNSGLGRADIWGLIAPGLPQVAAAYAHQDAIIDHAEEGVWAAMAWAAMMSAAFFVGDLDQIVRVGLAMMPKTCRCARAIETVRTARRNLQPVSVARAEVIKQVGSDNYSDVAQNFGFIVLGLYYGERDFGASLACAVNCGYSTASNAASLGALLGLIHGKSGLPSEWLTPIGDSIVLGWGVVNLKVERKVAELVEHTLEVGELVVAANEEHVQLVDQLPEPLPLPEPVVEVPLAPPVVESTEEVVQEPNEDLTQETTPDGSSPVVEEPGTATGFVLPDISEGAPSESPIIEPAPIVDATTAPDSEEPPLAIPSASVPPANLAALLVKPESVPVSPEIAPQPPVVVPPPVNWEDNSRVKPLLVAPVNSAQFKAGPFELTVDYGEGGPAIVPNVATSITIAIRNSSETEFMGHISMSVPDGWQVAVPGAQGNRQVLSPGGMARYGFVIRVPDTAILHHASHLTLVMTPEDERPLTCDIPIIGGSCWWVVGPLKNVGETGYNAGYEVEDKPGFGNQYLARGGGLITWEKAAFKDLVLPLERDYFRGSPGVLYGQTTLRVRSTMEARLLVHQNDGFKLWLNNELVLWRHSHDPFRPNLSESPSAVDIVLRPGDNRLFVKFVRDRDPYQFVMAITDRRGHPITDLGNSSW